MKTGLAIWHYPHRTLNENISFFAENGFDAVSILGYHFVDAVSDTNKGKELADTIINNNVILTVHHAFPKNHEEENVKAFTSGIDKIAKWQTRYGLISVLSFDVHDTVRDNMKGYLDYVMEKVKNTKIALEDFCLDDEEYNQIKHLKDNRNFGLLIDIGHMYIRLCGKNIYENKIFRNYINECPMTENPSYNEFITAFKHKQFPVYEIHLHNNDGERDMHYFLEDGVCDMSAVAEVIKDIDFDGIVTIESAPGFMFECKGNESDRRILKTYENWKELMK